MIQITDWLDPKEELFQGDQIVTNEEWLESEAILLAKKSGRYTTIKTNDKGHIALFKQKRGESIVKKTT
tara:strand:+ start:6964 stop:7170 length:207 start_codon:yes stop_codon:yes gene_type:complete